MNRSKSLIHQNKYDQSVHKGDEKSSPEERDGKLGLDISKLMLHEDI